MKTLLCYFLCVSLWSSSLVSVLPPVIGCLALMCLLNRSSCLLRWTLRLHLCVRHVSVCVSLCVRHDDITGPVANMQRNMESVALSLSCNLDLQVNHSRLLWRQAVTPAVLITQALMVSQASEMLTFLQLSVLA